MDPCKILHFLHLNNTNILMQMLLFFFFWVKRKKNQSKWIFIYLIFLILHFVWSLISDRVLSTVKILFYVNLFLPKKTSFCSKIIFYTALFCSCKAIFDGFFLSPNAFCVSTNACENDNDDDTKVDKRQKNNNNSKSKILCSCSFFHQIPRFMKSQYQNRLNTCLFIFFDNMPENLPIDVGASMN